MSYRLPDQVPTDGPGLCRYAAWVIEDCITSAEKQDNYPEYRVLLASLLMYANILEEQQRV